MRYFTLLLAIVCLWGGGQGVYTALKNTEPTIYDVNTLSDSKMPEEKWLTLNNCYYNLMESVYFESAFGNGLAEELYVPLNTKNDSIAVFVSIKDKNVLDVFNLVNSQTDAAKAEHFYNKYKHLIIKDSLSFSGVVRYGIDLDNKQWRELASVSPKLVKEFIILDANTAPNSKFSYVMLGLGVIFLFFAVRSFFRNKKSLEQ